MTQDTRPPPAPVVSARGLTLRYGAVQALDDLSLDIPAGCMVGLIGPDGVGKSSLMSLIAGARRLQEGHLEVMGGDFADATARRALGPQIAFMPQGLGRNLYPTLSVRENLEFFGRLFGQDKSERDRRIRSLLAGTGMSAFEDRPAGKLSGGMKQKLGLCCALIHDPDLLILDEPTTGVDPLSRRQFWDLIAHIRETRPGMSVMVSTAYMEEAAGYDWLVAMNAGRVLATGSPAEFLERTGTANLDQAFIRLLRDAGEADAPAEPVTIAPRDPGAGEIAIEAEHLTRRFGAFTAVDDVSFRIQKGEIFGFLGSNGCGKTTTMKMLTGLLEPSEGTAKLFGEPLDAGDMEVRRRVGFMTQAFSLYSELSVKQNLVLHARLFGLEEGGIAARVEEMARRFDLNGHMDALPDALPLGMRQRLSLAVAVIHGPEILILDEPTSGVDPVARDGFWKLLGELSRDDGVTIFVSTHFMNEAELCDRISLMHAGQVLVSDSAAALKAAKGTETLEAAFIGYLQEAIGESEGTADAAAETVERPEGETAQPEGETAQVHHGFSPTRLLSYALLETLQLMRDPIRATMALLGTLVLLVVMAYGISTDVEDLSFAVLDHDQTGTSRSLIEEIAGSSYFVEQAPLTSHADMDARMEAGSLDLAIEIPPDFARNIERGDDVEIGAWIDGSNPSLAETVQGYVQGVYASWMTDRARLTYGETAVTGDYTLQTRFRYNPDIDSIIAMAPGVIPLLLIMIPAMLTALAVVREKELGSILNFYVTPVTRLEFLLGKQLPYVVLGMFNFLLLLAMTVVVFRVPFTGSYLALTLAAFLYVVATTGIGLVISSFISSQIAAIFATTILTMIPATLFSGMIDPVSSLEGGARVIGEVIPTSHFITIARGTYSKGLGMADLTTDFIALILAIPVLLVLGTMLLSKQEK